MTLSLQPSAHIFAEAHLGQPANSETKNEAAFAALGDFVIALALRQARIDAINDYQPRTLH